MQSRDVRDMSEDGSYTRENGCETDDRVQRRDSLREFGGSDSSADQSAWAGLANTNRPRVTRWQMIHTSKGANSSDCAKLCQHFRRESNRGQGC